MVYNEGVRGKQTKRGNKRKRTMTTRARFMRLESGKLMTLHCTGHSCRNDLPFYDLPIGAKLVDRQGKDIDMNVLDVTPHKINVQEA